MEDHKARAVTQKEFMDIVNKMILTGCPLPNNFVLYHCIEDFTTPDEHTISIKSFLTERDARDASGLEEKPNGKYSNRTTYHVIKGNQEFFV